MEQELIDILARIIYEEVEMPFVGRRPYEEVKPFYQNSAESFLRKSHADLTRSLVTRIRDLQRQLDLVDPKTPE